MAPRRSTVRHASMPSANVANVYAARCSAGGTGWARSQTRVTMPERALGAEEQLVEVGPDGRRGRAAGADHGAVGEDDLEPDDDVLDLAVAGGVLAGAPAGDPAADGGDVEALREVADAEAVPVLQLGLEVRPERAGQDLDDARDGVDVDRRRPAR